MSISVSVGTMSFEQKVVLITGCSSDIGAITAKAFAKEGASLAIVDRNEYKLKNIAERCEQLGAPTLIIKADVSKDIEAESAVKKTINKFGKLDVLVNHAGKFREASILADHFLRTYDEVMKENMQGAIRVTYFAVPHLIKTKGNIVNVPSMAGISSARTSNTAYRTSKAAMIYFTKNIALELDLYGVRVNMISPSPDRKAIFNSLRFNSENHDTAPQPLSDPNEVVEMILYISSDKGKDITGTNFWLKLWASTNKKKMDDRSAFLRQFFHSDNY